MARLQDHLTTGRGSHLAGEREALNNALCFRVSRVFRGFKPFLSITFILYAIGLAITLALNADDLRAGAADSCVTPALGTRINGGLGPGTARYVHDDLFVRALVLDDGLTRLAFAVVDTCLRDRPVFDEAKKLIQRHTGLAPERVMISTTHTHSAGAGCGVHLTEADAGYRAWLRECVVATRRPGATEVEQARAVVANRSVETLTTWTDNDAREQLLLSEWPAVVSMPLQVFRLGDLAVAAWPGEIFASSGLELKHRSPIKPIFNLGLANGWYGYIPPPERFRLGAYKTWLTNSNTSPRNRAPNWQRSRLNWNH